MKKIAISSLAAIFLLSSITSCETMDSRSYLGTMAGAEIGGTIGEAIGWLSTSRHDGPGKAMLGSIIGTVAGAAIGNVLTSPKSKKEAKAERYNDYNDYNNYSSGRSNDYGDYQTGGGYDSYDYNNYSSRQSKKSRKYQDNSYTSNNGMLTISKVSYQDEDGDGRISRYETVNVIYEVTNDGQSTATVTLSVDDPDNSRNFAFSPSNTIDMRPGETVRYKAKVFCKSKPSSGFTNVRVYARSQTAGAASSSVRIPYQK